MRVWEWIKGWKRGIEKEKMQTKTQVKSVNYARNKSK